MEQIAIRNLTFSYDTESNFSLKDVTFSVEQGEIFLITGVSGCGKTTLLKHLKMEYMPKGERDISGKVYLNGKRIEELTEREQAKLVGFVGQNVEAGQVTDKVWHELAFGLENLGYSQEMMQRKVAEMTAFFGLEAIYHEKLCNLSGGQRQIVNLASVMVMEPEILVLDEPTSQLDPVAATDFFRMLQKINQELGTTIVMTEHHLEEVFSLCSRILVMEQGRVEKIGTPQQIAVYLREKGHPLYPAIPSAARIYLDLQGQNGQIPVTVREGRSYLTDLCQQKSPVAEEQKDLRIQAAKTEREDLRIQAAEEKSEKRALGNFFKKAKKTDIILQADEVWFRYERNGKDIVKACSLQVEKGKITALLGGNGAGKSTFLHLLAGHFQPLSGKIVNRAESVGLLPQNPQAMFAKKTVLEELLVSLPEEKKGKKQKIEQALENQELQKVIAFCGLQEVVSQHPFDLSGGQMQKLALAKLLLQEVEVLLLDEPGKGMDYAFKEEMGNLLRQLAEEGKTVLLVSHDVEFCARYADVCGLFFDGHVVSVTDSRSFFLENVFYTTSVVRMCRGILPQAVVVEDVLAMFSDSVSDAYSGAFFGEKGKGGIESQVIEKEKLYVDEEKEILSVEECGLPGQLAVTELAEEVESLAQGNVADLDVHNLKNDERTKDNRKTGLTRKRLFFNGFIYGIFFLLMPFTIYIGHTVLDQRKYYFISLLLIIEAIVAFLLRFERRKPKIREIMVIAVFSAIVVVGRAAFYMVPNIKPMAALVIIAGVGLGGETGFLVGAMSMLVSNIFFGQGPWTPWQMFVMGMIGFLAGMIFRQNTVCDRRKKYGICIFGFFAVLLVYGGIMNTSTVLMYQENVNLEMILASYAMGFPYDAIHAVSTFVFLWLGARPMLEKLDRVKSHF